MRTQLQSALITISDYRDGIAITVAGVLALVGGLYMIGAAIVGDFPGVPDSVIAVTTAAFGYVIGTTAAKPATPNTA